MSGIFKRWLVCTLSFFTKSHVPAVCTRHAYTGGTDCLVRIWRTDQGADQEPLVAAHANDSINTVSAAVCYILGWEYDALLSLV